MRPKLILIACLAVFLIGGNLLIDRWPTTLHHGDSNGYYLHVVSALLYHDVGDYSASIDSLKAVNPSADDPRTDIYGIRPTEKGRMYIKYTVGVPVLEAPFFYLAHAYASLSSKYKADGWSKPYMLSVNFAITFYVLLGLWLLMGVLERYFSFRAVALTVIALVVATNLFYHVTYVTMSHGFLFFLHCLLIYLSAKFYDRPNWIKAGLIGATVGLIALTRVPEVVSALVPLLWGVVGWNSFKERLTFLGKNWLMAIPAAVGLFLAFSPQIAYWYYVSGHLIFNPYQGEGFNFWKPNFWPAFFDFENGWLIYTPIMALSIIGLFLLRKYRPKATTSLVKHAPLFSIIAFVFLQAWIHYSYYVWSYFPGMGQRPMVETYPLLSFGLAACFATSLAKKHWKWLPYTAIILFGALNLFQTWQSKKGVIWTERSNAAFYWETFGKMSVSKNALRSYDTKHFQPNEAKIKLIRMLHESSFEADSLDVTGELVRTGDSALFSDFEYHTLVEKLPLQDLEAGNWLKMSIYAYMPKAHQVWNRDATQGMTIELYDAEGNKRRGTQLRLSPHLGNPSNNIWTTGSPDVWDEASFYYRLPKQIKSGWYAKIYLANTVGQKLYLDDFSVGYWE